ncbi:MAG TPA: polysaccharide deacetylase family protein [Polyangiaceae bacterium LLY-WYZ-15_(1-7)]|nr:hypothetical protein [Sandaracinus sp.]HJL05253.1 polysaccharide deacetylase family protein [Polyangiaceae bacterium LLY-WYZ-15_(1-7)]HJL07453.1 polysaccharide deacetylase family protein [Polyangiaceae bacterium LLY-WYZ-15_(1-7)]HJL36532.1 polysaccharide deacetylase family protein [Polyangiaceae bacterium LLY-WYZ-15_(1-7)]HJL45739.1 polysaccharide deacetylase family protein [Polyangiaceae bacterium LLY-WYZ-15_(1-7)]
MRWKTLLGSLTCLLALAGGALLAEHGQVHASAPTRVSLDPVHVRIAAAPTAPASTLAPERREADMVFGHDETRVRHAVGEAFRGGRIVTGATPHRLILFTFDDGPDRRSTPRLLRYLDETGVRAVFFVTTSRIEGLGSRVDTQADILRDIARRGHLVGSHTVDHPQLPLLETDEAIAQIEESQAAIERVVGARPWLFRPPGGSRSPRVDRLLADRGYTQLLWNLGSGDFQVRTADDVVDTWRRVLERRERENGERGGIILLHDTHPWSVEAFPRIVDWLRRRNCELLDQGEELYDIVDDPALFFAARQSGDDASTEAAPATPTETVLALRQRRLRAEARQRCQRLATR